MIAIRFAALIAATAAALPAGAVEYGQVQTGQSNVTFVSKQMGVPVDGRFRKFAATLAFDPTRPGAAAARVDIDVASIDTGSKEADDEVSGKAWFDAKAFPTASFVSTAVRPLGGDRYQVAGRLAIKGRSRDIVAPATFRQAADKGVFDGEFTVRRLDFGLGEGAWSDIGTVADEVLVRFHIVAIPRK